MIGGEFSRFQSPSSRVRNQSRCQIDKASASFFADGGTKKKRVCRQCDGVRISPVEPDQGAGRELFLDKRTLPSLPTATVNYSFSTFPSKKRRKESDGE